ncbi:MAG: MATE family Na+-driven efflux transporter [Plesiomonas sp.]
MPTGFMNHTQASRLAIRTRASLSRINWPLYLALLITAALPTIYTTTRIYYLGDLPTEWGVNIASQLAWVNLGLEVVQEALILPLFYLLGKTLHERGATLNKLKTGLIVTVGIYSLFTGLIALFAMPLVQAMAQNPEQVAATVDYIRLEMIGTTLFNAVRFLTIFFVLQDWRRAIYTVLAIQLLVSVTLDTLLLSQFEFSFRLGVNGIAYSNIVASICTLVYALGVVRQRYRLTSADLHVQADFGWMWEWFRVGKWSGVDSLIRNAFFLIFIIRMINVVEEQGTFWVANSFIWGWLLLPFLPMADLIKQDVSQGDKLPHWDKMLGYFTTCVLIAIAWILLSPGYEWFIRNILNTAITQHLHLILLSLPFYMLFMFNTCMDSVLYGRGQTRYLAIQSVITNVTVYGTAYVCYLQGWLTPSLDGIAILFGCGIAVDTLVTGWLYNRHLRQENYAV